MSSDRPVYFTRDAWASLTPAERELMRRNRMHRVTELAAEHHSRYHAAEALARLAMAAHDSCTATGRATTGRTTSSGARE